MRIMTFVKDAIEIDIDDRGAELVVRLEMMETTPLALEAQNLVVNLHFDFGAGPHADAVNFGGKKKGPYPLITKAQKVTLRPGLPIERSVTVRTGVFSATPMDINTLSAKVGRKEIDVELEYQLAPANPAGTVAIERDLTMQLVVSDS